MSTAAPRLIASIAASLLLIVGSIGGAAASGTGGAPTRETKIVKAISTHWSPGTVRISAGDKIKWKAVSNSHTVTAYGGNWHFDKDLSQGETEDHRFANAGNFKFRCRIHSSLVSGVCSGMCGKVVVSA